MSWPIRMDRLIPNYSVGLFMIHIFGSMLGMFWLMDLGASSSFGKIAVTSVICAINFSIGFNYLMKKALAEGQRKRYQRSVRKFITTEYGETELDGLIKALTIEVEGLEKQLDECSLRSEVKFELETRLQKTKQRLSFLREFSSSYVEENMQE